MRVIKFRAWDKQDEIMWQPLTLQTLIEGRWELQNEDQSASLPHRDYLEFAHKDTVWMQFTGLKDTHGKEIYDGDICTLFTKAPTKIIEKWGAFGYESGGGMFICLASNHWFLFDSNGQSENIEVIGNIFENPELLEA